MLGGKSITRLGSSTLGTPQSRCLSSGAEHDGFRHMHCAAPRVARETASIRMQAVPTAEAEPSSPVQRFFQESWPAPEPSKLVNGRRVFKEEHRIRGYEVGPDQRTTITTIANLLQEVASNHAVAMWGRSAEGFATDPALAAQGLIFVMTRMQIQMDEYPRWGDIVQIDTWFHASGKIGAQRDWMITNKSTGKQIGRATSTWVMINMHTRRLAKMPEDTRKLLNGFQFVQDTIPPEYTKLKIPDLDEVPEVVGPLQVARRSDMDMNGHINNVVYLAWGLETVPRDVHNNCHLYQMEIDFKAECHSGDVVESLASSSQLPNAMASNGAGPDALTFVHMLRRCEGEACTELVRARTTWRAGEKP